MYDKIKFMIHKCKSTIHLGKYVCRQEINKRNRRVGVGWVAKQFRLEEHPDAFYVIGSLSKYYYGDNLHDLNRCDTEQAIKNLFSELEVEPNMARIVTVEIGKNFIVKHPTEKYISRLGNKPYMNQFRFNPKTAYYKSNGKRPRKTVRVYDKIDEARTHKQTIPIAFEGSNVLRIELALARDVAAQVKRYTDITADMLYNEDVYRHFADIWRYEYDTIIKNRCMKDDYSEISTASEAYDYICAVAFEKLGQESIDNLIMDMKRAGSFKDRTIASRLKKRISKTRNKVQCGKDELCKELDDCVINATAYID